MSSRNYASPVREQGARQTRLLIARAARDLFLEHGYAATSMAAIARAAGVSGQTVYNAFGSKAALLKHVYDITLVGDDEPVPFAQRPDVQAVYARQDPREFLAGYAGLGLVLLSRLGPLIGVIMAGAAAGDTDLVAQLETMGRERLVGATMAAQRAASLGALRPGVDLDQARDAIWTLNSVEVWRLLTVERGWSDERYADWVGRAMADAVLA
jgi:AcrR family transcriptional regulator